MKKIILLSMIATGLLHSYTLSAQSEISEAPLAKLSFMVGEWQGKGWMMTQQGKQLSLVTEIVECKQNCSMFVVTGLGVKKDSVTHETQTVHDAFGIITFDKPTGKYMMRAYKNGQETFTELELVSERVVRWNLETPGGKVRFTTDFSDANKWKETGEFSRDGVSWMQIMGMELEKKK